MRQSEYRHHTHPLLEPATANQGPVIS